MTLLNSLSFCLLVVLSWTRHTSIMATSSVDDILSPTLVNVGGRFYRVQGSASTHGSAIQLRGTEAEEEPGEEEEGIKEAPGGSAYAILYADEVLFPKLIGKGGSRAKSLERECGVKMVLPGKSAKLPQGVPAPAEGEVLLLGGTKSAVASALARTQVAISEAIRSPQTEYTHFVSVPMNTCEVATEAWDALKAAIEAEGSEEKRESLAPRGKLHVTLVMLKLCTKSAREEAQEAIRECSGELLEGCEHGGLPMRAEGLDIMNDEYDNARVLHLKLNDISGVVARVAGAVRNALRRRDLLLEKDDAPPKLHCTLLNARYSGREAGFGVRSLLERCKEGEIGRGSVKPMEVHLSTRFSQGDDGYYAPAAVVPLC